MPVLFARIRSRYPVSAAFLRADAAAAAAAPSPPSGPKYTVGVPSRAVYTVGSREFGFRVIVTPSAEAGTTVGMFPDPLAPLLLSSKENPPRS